MKYNLSTKKDILNKITLQKLERKKKQKKIKEFIKKTITIKRKQFLRHVAQRLAVINIIQSKPT